MVLERSMGFCAENDLHLRHPLGLRHPETTMCVADNLERSMDLEIHGAERYRVAKTHRMPEVARHFPPKSH